MRDDFLAVLRCPFCGGELSIGEGAARAAGSNALLYGILNCECCAYPVVDGIPCMRAGAFCDAVMENIGAGQHRQALGAMLGVTEARMPEVDELATDGTFRRGLEVLGGDADASYMLHRFCNPTFLASDALVRSVGQDERWRDGRALDLGGGTGHLSRSLSQGGSGREVVLADISYWQIWLAKRFVAPSCQPVWCDANDPLPFAPAAFSLALCSDAFHYVWQRRSLARELTALVEADGVMLLPHLHNAHEWNYSQGMPLSPARYRALFAGAGARLFAESEILDAVVEGGEIDLAHDHSDGELADEAALVLVASRGGHPFRTYEVAPPAHRPGRLSINPLYETERNGDGLRLTLRFPSAAYEDEFAQLKRFLPPATEIGPEDAAALEAGRSTPALEELMRRFVLIDLPARYV